MAKIVFIGPQPKTSLISRLFASKSPLIALSLHDPKPDPETLAQLQKLAVPFTIAVTRPFSLIVFHREILDYLDQKKLNPSNIVSQLLHTAADLGFSRSVHPTGQKNPPLEWRIRHLFHELALGLTPAKFYRLPGSDPKAMVGAGMAYKKRRFMTHTTLSHHNSAIFTFSHSQKITMLLFLLVAIFGFVTQPFLTGVMIVGLLSLIYFSDVCFSLYLVLKSLHFPPELSFTEPDLAKLKNDKLPIYTILCPLYKEANVLPHFLDSVASLDWPKDKLDVQLLLEEDDEDTIAVARSLSLPSHIRIVVVPHSQPKTKPKACNYGLHHAKGEFVVVYDAEDRPDPLQLKKAYLAFKNSSEKVACVQAKLNYFNPHQNLLTRFFTAEYSLWFDVVLPGLQSIATTIPLGGTSNHFRTKVLIQLEGWDAFNVTEDCDLGSRIFKIGYSTVLIDSVTLEEANSSWRNWLRQRSRWIKGYLQTYLVHTRNFPRFLLTHGIHAIIFQLVVGLRMTFMIVNPFLWLATIAYFTLYSIVGPTIEAFYPATVFYLAAISLVFGNFLYLYYYMIGCAKRGAWPLIKWVFLIPVYWLAISIAAWKAFYQLIVKPHFWEKTHHGLDKKIKKDSKISTQESYFSASLFVALTFVATFLNYLYNAYLGRAKNVSLEEFGVISLIGSFLYLTQIPSDALSKTVTYKSAFMLGKNLTPAAYFWRFIRTKTTPLAVLTTIVWILAIPTIARVFEIDSLLPLVIFTPIWLMAPISAVDFGFLRGTHKFGLLGVINVLEAVLKLVVTIILVQVGLPKLVYLAIPVSLGLHFLISWYASWKIYKNTAVSDEPESHTFPKRFFATSVLEKISSLAFLVLDVVLAKLLLSGTDAGLYGLISLVGKMVFFVGSTFSQLVTPIISKSEGAGSKSKSSFYILLGLTTLACLGGYLFVGILAPYTVPLLLGDKTLPILGLLPAYTFAMVAFAVASCIVNYNQIKKRYAFPVLGFFIALVQIVALAIFHDSLQTFVNVMLVLSLVYLVLTILSHIFYDSLQILLHHLQDFFDLFSSLPFFKRKVKSTTSLRILIMNWYDIKHVWAGGAEIYIHNIAKDWVKEGHEVTMFTGNDWQNPRHEIVDGVRLVRRGGLFTVAIWAFVYYVLKFRGKFDVVIDIPKGVPFFTPFYVRKPIICLVHQVHQEMFRTELKFPFKQLSLFLEAVLMPFIYRRTPFVAVSESTKSAIQKLGMGKSDITIVNPGVEITRAKVKKTPYPQLLYLGRLRSYKSVDLLLLAAANLRVKYPNLKVVIAGRGEDEDRLRGIAAQLDIKDLVDFRGAVTDSERARLFTESWVAVQPSIVEGWGITNIEANSCGTPVVAANSEGLRDSVIEGSSGFLFAPGDHNSLEVQIDRILSSTTLRASLEKSSIIWAQNFSWEESGKRLMGCIKDHLVMRHRYSENQGLSKAISPK